MPQEQWADLPARYALVELTNLHDASLEFEPIHRVLFGVDPKALLQDFLAAYEGAHLGQGEGHVIEFLHAEGAGRITVPPPRPSSRWGPSRASWTTICPAHGGRIDYIHGDEVARGLGRKEGNLAFLLPAMEKRQLFPTVIFDGVLPRKTFSMGHANDKRFYLEARKIR